MSSASDIVIVGGGLAGGLATLIFSIQNPDKSVRLVDAKKTLGGKNTWLFHESEVSATAMEALRPMVAQSWDEASVQFPKQARKLKGPWHVIRSADFNRVLKDGFGDDVLHLGVKVSKLTDSVVTLEDGTELEGKCVIDARGLDELPTAETNGFRKHLGYDMTLEQPHELTAPILIDATCPQLDGLRYFRLVPWTENSLLVEETFYSDSSDLNADRISRSVKAYVERRGWNIASIEGEERFVGPVPLTSESIKVSVTGEPLPIGSRAGYFNATTGDALADAVRFAEMLAKLPKNPKTPVLTTTVAREQITRLRRPWLSRQRFYRLINRLLFQASEPSLRYTILQSFYDLPEETITRFTGGRITWTDRMRILGGKSPVSLSVAMKHFSERSAAERAAMVKQ